MASGGMASGGMASGGMASGGMASGGMGGGIEPLSRSVFIRKLSPHVRLEDLANEVGAYGAIDSFRIDSERHEAYVNFIDGQSAAALLEERPLIPFPGQPQPAECAWGKKKSFTPELYAAIQSGATRNLYVGGLPENITNEGLEIRFAQFGPIESVRVMKIQGNGYVNYTSIESAVRAKEALRGVKVAMLFPDFGEVDVDKEVQITFTTAQQNCRRRQIQAVEGLRGMGGGRGDGGRGGAGVDAGGGRGGRGTGHLKPLPKQHSRSIYVGNLPHGIDISAVAELSLPYGLLESVKFFQTYAFLNFVDDAASDSFWQQGQMNSGAPGIFLRGRSLMVNWGRPLPVDPAGRAAIGRGATRHIAIGPTSPQTTQAQVSEILAPFGEVEAVRLLPENGYAVVNMMNIQHAIAAKEALHSKQMSGPPPYQLECQYVTLQQLQQLQQQPRFAGGSR